MKKTDSNNSNTRRHAGITLVETVLSLLIISGAFVAALNSIASARAAQAVVSERQLGIILAEDLMAEILSKPNYKEGSGVGPEVDEMATFNRSLFDDMDDYHAWASSPPVDAEGNTIAGAEAYTRSVSVNWANTTNPDLDALTDTGLVRITVTVKRGDKQVAELTAFRSDVWNAPGEDY